MSLEKPFLHKRRGITALLSDLKEGEGVGAEAAEERRVDEGVVPLVLPDLGDFLR